MFAALTGMCQVRWFAVSAKPSSEWELVLVSRVKFCTLSAVPWAFQFCTSCEGSGETSFQVEWLWGVVNKACYCPSESLIKSHEPRPGVFLREYFYRSVVFLLFKLYRVWKTRYCSDSAALSGFENQQLDCAVLIKLQRLYNVLNLDVAEMCVLPQAIHCKALHNSILMRSQPTLSPRFHCWLGNPSRTDWGLCELGLR